LEAALSTAAKTLECTVDNWDEVVDADTTQLIAKNNYLNTTSVLDFIKSIIIENGVTITDILKADGAPFHNDAIATMTLNDCFQIKDKKRYIYVKIQHKNEEISVSIENKDGKKLGVVKVLPDLSLDLLRTEIIENKIITSKYAFMASDNSIISTHDENNIKVYGCILKIQGKHVIRINQIKYTVIMSDIIIGVVKDLEKLSDLSVVRNTIKDDLGITDYIFLTPEEDPIALKQESGPKAFKLEDIIRNRSDIDHYCFHLQGNS